MTAKIVTIGEILNTPRQQAEFCSNVLCSTECAAVTPSPSETKSVEVLTSQPADDQLSARRNDNEDENNGPEPSSALDELPEIPRWTPELNAQELKNHRLACRGIARQMAIDASQRLRRGEVCFSYSIRRYVCDTQCCDLTRDIVVQLLVEAGYPASQYLSGDIRFELRQ